MLRGFSQPHTVQEEEEERPSSSTNRPADAVSGSKSDREGQVAAGAGGGGKKGGLPFLQGIKSFKASKLNHVATTESATGGATGHEESKEGDGDHGPVDGAGARQASADPARRAKPLPTPPTSLLQQIQNFRPKKLRKRASHDEASDDTSQQPETGSRAAPQTQQSGAGLPMAQAIGSMRQRLRRTGKQLS